MSSCRSKLSEPDDGAGVDGVAETVGVAGVAEAAPLKACLTMDLMMLREIGPSRRSFVPRHTPRSTKALVASFVTCHPERRWWDGRTKAPAPKSKAREHKALQRLLIHRTAYKSRPPLPSTAI